MALSDLISWTIKKQMNYSSFFVNLVGKKCYDIGWESFKSLNREYSSSESEMCDFIAFMINILHNYDTVQISGKFSNSQIFMGNLRNMYHNEYDLDLYINEPVLQWFKSESENKDSQIFKNFVNLRNDKNLPDLKTRKPLEIITYLIETVEKSRDTDIKFSAFYLLFMINHMYIDSISNKKK